MFKLGTYQEANKIRVGDIDDSYILHKYFGIHKLPCLICAPYRRDVNPSVGLYLHNGKIYFKDFAKGLSGSVIDLLIHTWHCSFKEVMRRLAEDSSVQLVNTPVKYETKASKCLISVKLKEWSARDIEYWESYGCSMPLVRSNVIPIQKYWINNKVYNADLYSYAFPILEGENYRYKIYQPYNKKIKWINNYLPNTVHFLKSKSLDKIVICSSLKDAMCLKSNSDCSVIAGQSENLRLSDNVLALLSEYNSIYVLFDNDKSGLDYGKEMETQYGFKNIVIPPFDKGKDISDYYKQHGNINLIKQLIENGNNS